MGHVKNYGEFLFESQNREIFNQILESLNSARNLFLKTQKIPETIFNQLAESDPTSQKKYLEKLCKFYLENPNLDELKELIEIFDTLVTKKQIDKIDINRFKSFDEFKNLVLQNKDKKSKTQIEKEIKISDAEIILNSDDFLIVSPLSHKASCIYGAGTKWCTTDRDSQHWDRYTDQFVKFYYILNKNLSESDNNYKIAVAVYLTGEKECYDATDKIIDFKEVLKLGLNKDLFKSENLTYGKLIKKWILGTYEIVDDKYNVQGNVEIQYLDKLNLTELPIKFGYVSGYFNCYFNQLTSLKGCPDKVDGNFNCFKNKLISLEGCPKEVGGNFNCYSNKLKTLKYCPEKIGGVFNCSDNQLISLEGCPEKVNGNFLCYDNQLISLKGCPKIIQYTFDCCDNLLTSLEYSPKEVGGNFYCSSNKLISLKGAPKIISDDFICDDNQLTSLEGCPEKVDGHFHAQYNKVKFTKEQVLQLCNVDKSKILV